MAFYGKINSNAKSSFSFDKVYPTRQMADLYAQQDGIFVGRFVLVDYDHGDYSTYSTIPDSSDPNALIIEENGSIKKVKTGDTTYKYQIYQNGSWNDFEIGYSALFNLDTAAYGTQRGYDSTVWQKVSSPTTGRALYAMTAELNSVVPTFEMKQDGPSSATTDSPDVYFGPMSNDVYYDLHMLAPWKFKLKTIPETSKNKVYYNAKGFDDKIIHYSSDDKEELALQTDIIDNISLDEVSSGAIYYDKALNTYRPMLDTKQWTVTLPTIGDSVAHLWDIVYGGKELYKDSKNPNKRNTKVAWDNSYSGLRLLKYDSKQKGYTYNTQEVSTLAGAINSTHDLIGKIIRVYNNEKLEDLSDARIYYVPFTDPESEEPAPTPAAGAENCKPGHYYYRYTHYVPDVRNNDPDYGLLEHTTDAADKEKLEDVYLPTEEDIEEYLADGTQADNLWYQENDTDYTYETGDIEESKDYVEILENNFTEIGVGPRYKKNTFYYKEVNNGTFYHLDDGDEADDSRSYFNLTPVGGEKESYFYKSGVFFYRKKNYTYTVNGTTMYPQNLDTYDLTMVQWSNPERLVTEEGFVGVNNLPQLCNDSNPNTSQYEYYVPDVTQILPEGGGASGQNAIYGVIKLRKITNDNIVKFKANNFYEKVDETTFKLISTDPAATDAKSPHTYWLITTAKVDYFYEKDKYYYRESIDVPNYILNTHDVINEDGSDYDPNDESLGAEIQYTTFDPAITTGANPHLRQVGKIFPKNTFYEKEDDEYIPVDAPDEEIETYYELKEWYVYSDTNEVYTPGMKWNLSFIPAGVKLSRRKKVYSLVELNGFARDYNSLHGLILKLHDMMGDGADRASYEYVSGVPYLERDEDNIRGAIQTMEDKWREKFGALVPGSMVVVDTYGRLSGGAAGGDKWINVELDHNGVNLSHIGPDTAIDNIVANETPSFGGTFTIQDLEFDNKGHKSGTGKTHTVKIPQGSLIDAASNGGDVITKLTFVGSSGQLTTTRTNIGSLQLVGYSGTATTPSVLASLTLNGALAALDQRIETAEGSATSALSTAVGNLAGSASAQDGYALTGITQTNGVIGKSSEMQIAGVYAPLHAPNLEAPYLNSYTNSTTNEVTVPMAVDVVYRSGTTPVSTKQIANIDYVDNQIGTAIGSLDATVNASAGHAITGITEVDGIITSISEAELVDYSTDITSLGGRISTLEALNLATRIQALEDAIAALSGGNEEPTPDPEPDPGPEPDPENPGE